MYEVSGVVSGGLSDLLSKSTDWSASSTERLQDRASRRRAIVEELGELKRSQARRHQPTSQISVKIDAQNKLLEVAEAQRSALVRLFETLGTCQ